MLEPDYSLVGDASELVIPGDGTLTCESFIFEPAPTEQALGQLFAVGETIPPHIAGQSLLDLSIQAAQQEYYRDVDRGILSSFESALHQANLVLHDVAEAGDRTWMGHWHAAIGVLAGSTLHVSTAGNGIVYMIRRTKVTDVSEGLSSSPIINPLRTFSQVASGALMAHDVIYLGSSGVSSLFRREDLSRFAMENNANTITTRLQQLYADQQAVTPIGAIAVSLLPKNVAVAKTVVATPESLGSKRERDLATPLRPRQPLVIHHTLLRSIFVLLSRVSVAFWQWLKAVVVPLAIRGSRQGGRAVVQVSAATGRNVQALAKMKRPEFSPQKMISLPTRIGQSMLRRLVAMPRLSKVFASVTLVLAIALGISLLFLQQKRTSDEAIERASELLHDAQTKQAAAETALIYDNRDQAHALLAEARAGTEQLAATDLYQEETVALQAAITKLDDRLQRVVRSSTAAIGVLGDFAANLDSALPQSLVSIGDTIYTYHPVTNAIIALNQDGESSVATTTTEGIGFFEQAFPHEADKTVVFMTDTPGVALFDAKRGDVAHQDIQLASAGSNITSGATFGNRLYLYDATEANIFGFSKTLSGYGVGTGWIIDDKFPADDIVSLAVDGSIYTLHRDGSVRELFKGEAIDWSLESVSPLLTGATKIITTEELANIYVFDPAHKRVVVFTKTGELVQQMLLDVATKLSDIAVKADESVLYALDGTRVLTVPLNDNN